METDRRTYKYYEAWAALREAHDIISRAQEERCQQVIGVSLCQMQILFLVKMLEHPATAGEISRWLFRAPHTITQDLDRMEAQNLIIRVRDLPKKNHKRIELTEKGETAYNQAIESEILTQIMANLSDRQIRNTVSIMKKLSKAALANISSISRKEQEAMRSRLTL